MVPPAGGQIAENLDSAEPLGKATIGTFKSWLPSEKIQSPKSYY
jgi:hypothetical protein